MFLAAVLVLAGGVDGAAAARSVTLGLVAPAADPDSPSLVRGVQLAVAEANQASGTDVAVKLEVRSGDGQWGTVGNEAVMLVCERHVDALITPADGGAAHLILQVAGRTRVPVASLCADASVTGAGVPWAVRVVARTDQEAAAIFAATRRADARPLRWSAIIPAGRAGRAIRRDLASAARSAATRVEPFIEIEKPTTELAVAARTIAAAAPDGVLLWLPPGEAGAAAAVLRSAGYRGHLAGPACLDSSAFLTAAGDAARATLVPAFQTDAGARSRAERFEEHYQRKYDERPDFRAEAAFDAATVLIEALRRGGSDGRDNPFPAALAVAGITGVLRFDASGNRLEALQVLTWTNGRLVAGSPDKS